MSDKTDSRLELTDIRIRRGGRLVVDGVSLTAHSGLTVGIIGPNGAGKSSLLMAIYQAIKHERGTILINDQSVAAMTRRQIARNVAVVAQETESTLPLSVRDSINLGRLAHRSLIKYGDDIDKELVEQAMARVGVSELADRLITELSGGERQRVLIARAIVQDAPFLLLDEPTNHLDLANQFQLFDLVETLNSTTILVMHDINLAGKVCDELVLIDHGKPVVAGPTNEVLTPQIISEVYGVHVERITHNGEQHLLFSPKRTSRKEDKE